MRKQNVLQILKDFFVITQILKQLINAMKIVKHVIIKVMMKIIIVQHAKMTDIFIQGIAYQNHNVQKELLILILLRNVNALNMINVSIVVQRVLKIIYVKVVIQVIIQKLRIQMINILIVIMMEQQIMDIT